MNLVEITWLDAEEYGDIGWNSLKDMKAYSKKPCPKMRTVGYILFKDETHIAVVSTIGKKDCSSVNKIPCEFIIKIDHLKN